MRCTPATDVYLMDVYPYWHTSYGHIPYREVYVIGVHLIGPVHFTEYAYYPLALGKYAF
jgi:hypothetical protein